MADGLRLFESLLHEPRAGYFLLDRHLARLAASARTLDFDVDVDAARSALGRHAAGLGDAPRKVRLEASRDGAFEIEDVAPKPSTPVVVALAREPVDSADPMLRHKTSARGVYERALAGCPEVDDVLLHNERGELTESAVANLVLEIEGRRLTPPVACGLLPGTFRAHLLDTGEVEEAVLEIAALDAASRVFIVNSVRRWCEVRRVEGREDGSRSGV